MVTLSTASELAPFNIRVNAIAPGIFAAHLNSEQRSNHAKLWQKRCERIPLKMAGQPEDICPLALLLASDEGSLITGEVISIDGGIVMNSLIVEFQVVLRVIFSD